MRITGSGSHSRTVRTAGVLALLDASGNLYGTTQSGGTGCETEGCGTVFELVNDSGVYAEKILHNFDAVGDGENLLAPLIMDNAGNLYSTTGSGGGFSQGSVFQVNPTATAPAVILSVLALTFDNQLINSTSAGQTVTVTNSGSADLIFGSGAVTAAGASAANFAINANTCSGTTVTPGATCAVTVTFSPPAVGPESAILSFADDASTSPQTVELSGTGVTAPIATGVDR